MTRRRLAQLGRMGTAEILSRSRTGVRIAIDRARATVVSPRWRRSDLRRTLSGERTPADLRQAVTQQQWTDAHLAVARLIASGPQRFVIADVRYLG